MAKPKNLEQLRAEKEQVETQLAQEQHKLERLENRKKYLEKGERQKRTQLTYIRTLTGPYCHASWAGGQRAWCSAAPVQPQRWHAH